MSRRRWEAADTVVAVCVGLLLIVFVAFAILIWQGYDTTVANAAKKARNGATQLANQTEWTIAAGKTFLDTVASYSTPLTPAGEAAIAAALANFPEGTQWAIYDSGGQAVRQSADTLPASMAESGQFAALAGGGDFLLGPLPGAHENAAASFSIARRLEANGSFAGLAVLAFAPTFLEDFRAPLDLDAESTISLVREDGQVIARHPGLGNALSLAQLPVYKTLMAAERGSYVSPSSPADGVARVVAFEHLPGVGLLALTSVSQDSVMAGLWTSVRIVSFLLGPIGLALLIGSLWTARLLRQTERNRRQLATALEHNEVLFREIHHRVKNNLQAVSALLQMQSIPVDIKQKMSQRIAAMSAVHEHIYRSNDFATVKVKDYLQTLIQNIRASHSQDVVVEEQLADLAVDKDIAAPLGLILNEVVSNAFKHAFGDRNDGKIRIVLEKSDDGSGRLVVEDDGVGYDPDTPTKGIGQRLIKALTQQIGGSSEVTSGPGARFTLRFPLAG